MISKSIIIFFLRQILEKTSTFLGVVEWKELLTLLPNDSEGASDAYYNRIINLCSHGKHSGEETSLITENDKKVLGFLVREIKKTYHFKKEQTNKEEQMTQYNTIAESNNFIVLDEYEKYSVLNEPSVVYQTEASLEHEFIQDLRNQGYEYLPDLNTPEALLANVRVQLQDLNDVVFTDSEWNRYVEEYLDKLSDSLVEKTRKIQDDYIYDFVFDDGHIKNIYLVDKQNLSKNKVQVIRQFVQKDHILIVMM